MRKKSTKLSSNIPVIDSAFSSTIKFFIDTGIIDRFSFHFILGKHKSQQLSPERFAGDQLANKAFFLEI